jgi:hypothetical protein
LLQSFLWDQLAAYAKCSRSRENTIACGLLIDTAGRDQGNLWKWSFQRPDVTINTNLGARKHFHKVRAGLANVAMAPIGGLLALLLTGTHFSVSSGAGFLALFGVSVQTGVIMLEYINQLRAAGHTIESAAIEGAVLRLRPIMMTMLVATLGLLPAALSRGIGSDSQRPFAIVIVGGLIGALLLSIFLLPTLYVWVARDGDKLPEPEADFGESS